MFYNVNVWDRASYTVEAHSKEQAENLASEFWAERAPHTRTEVVGDEYEITNDIFDYLYEILEAKAKDENIDFKQRLAYDNIKDMLISALRNDWRALKQFDDRRT